MARVSEGPTAGRLVLRSAAATAASIEATAGLALSGRINTATEQEGCAVLRLGPDEWLLLADAERDPWLASRIDAAVAGEAASIVDVTHRNAGLTVEGEAVEDVLAAGCPLPLDTQAFPVGRATRTLLAKAEIVLWRQATDRFHVEVARSFAPYVVAFLAGAIDDEEAIARYARG
jgi:sarcosine oxidase subunit gamma